MPLFYPAKYLPCVTAGVSWGALGWIDGAGRFSLPETSRYNISVKDSTLLVHCVLIGMANQCNNKIYSDHCKSTLCSFRTGKGISKWFAINNFS